MSIDKALTPLLEGEGTSLEIEIEDPESVEISTGDVTIILSDEPQSPDEFRANLAEFIDEGTLNSMASEILELVDADIQSRQDWADMFVKGLEVLGMKYEERTDPWEGSCGVYSPILTEAAVRFQSEMIVETFPAQGPVKTQIIGEESPEKTDAAVRVRADMNFRLTEEMIEYRPEHERLLYALGLSGSAFKKVYYDSSIGRQVAVFVPAEDIIMPYGASNIYVAERVTHVMRKTKNDIQRLQEAKHYRNVDLGEPVRVFTDIEKKKAEQQGYTLNDDERYQIFECHLEYNIPGMDDDSLPKPYVVTIDKSTQKILSIYRNYKKNDKFKHKRQHFTQYNYIPGFGAYGLGYVHLIGGYARAGTSLIRQLVDAGTLSNLPGGLKTRGLRIKGDDTPISPGEFRDVDVPMGTLKDNFMTLPYKEPSQVLAGLLDRITEDGRRLAGIADLKVSDMSAQAPVGTTLAILERQLKTMSAVQARVHASLKMEFKLLKEIIRDYMPPDYSYIPEGGDRAVKQEDYDIVEIIPVSDPNAATMAQRIMQYQAALQLAQGAPQIYDLPMLHRQMLEVLGIKEAQKLVPQAADQKPRDPISENMSFLTGKPTKAFIYQDHEAHIATHSALLQDPTIMGALGQTPMAAQMQGAIMAHIAEHMAFNYRAKIEEQLGVPMTAPDAEIPPEAEVQISRLVAQAAQQLLQTNQAKAQQQQAQQQAQNPEMAIKQQEIALWEKEIQQKDADSQRDFEIANRKLDLQQAGLGLGAQKEAAKLNAKEQEIDKKLKVELLKNLSRQ